MTTQKADFVSLTLPEAVRAVRKQIQERQAPFRLELPIVATDPLAWLEAQTPDVRVYWRSRNTAFELAGIGAADVQTSATLPFSHIAGVRYFGGQRFDPSYPHKSSTWDRFSDCRLLCPQVEISRHEHGCRLAVNLLRETERPKLEDQLAAMKLLAAHDGGPAPVLVSRRSLPDRAGWDKIITQALVMIHDGRLSKVALARTLQLEFKTDLNPWHLLRQLREGADHCFLFGIQPEEGTAFVGATPERLYQRTGAAIATEAVAGTRPRGSSPEEDSRVGSELLHSDKDCREQKWVVDELSESLGRVTTAFAFEPTTLMKLQRLQHLTSQAEGTLKPEITDRELLGALPPTPAVAGYPRPAAIAAIRSIEPFDRGWYAGPVGWIGANEAEFAVGIRSVLVHGRELTAYAGVGIVEGSTPEAEWQESEQKLASVVGGLKTN